ncbi:MAG: 4-hydroxy-tetrahydrodipicolinate synthase, partial [Deltaproteobacteria bacterium]|nr:4-hydroxy-tetrahydrodipicolinate synthase [Deltaproteobacteria bacterium]
LAKSLGADAALVVTPYYNKPTQAGLFEHYKTIACEAKFPLVIYNVPGRTGVNILPETVNRLSYLDNVVSVKEASGSITQSQEILAGCRSGFTVLSGEDALTLPLYSIGVKGVVSVASNVAPAEMVELRRLFLSGDFRGAMDLQAKLYPLFRTLFIETNPQPVKAALSILGFCGAAPRLPLVKAGDTTFTALKEILKNLGLTGV